MAEEDENVEPVEEAPVEAPTEVLSTPEWASGIEDGELKGAASKFESREALLDAVGFKAKDWREDIADEDAKKFAESSADINHLVKRAMDLRKQVSNAVPKLGKNATEEQVSAYRKAMGIPDEATKYEFPAQSDGGDAPEEVKASQALWAERFHSLNVPKDTAAGLVKFLAEDAAKIQEAQVEADKAFAKAQEEALRDTWQGEDYEINKALANRAFSEMASRSGVALDTLRKMETKDGRFLMDNADMVKLFSVVGREMAEGTLGPAISDSERETGNEQIQELRQKIREAQDAGDSKLANKLYQKEQGLIKKYGGDQPIIGSQGRQA
jgi:hypothetical protein